MKGKEEKQANGPQKPPSHPKFGWRDLAPWPAFLGGVSAYENNKALLRVLQQRLQRREKEGGDKE